MLNIELLHDPEIPLLGTRPEELKTGNQTDIYIPNRYLYTNIWCSIIHDSHKAETTQMFTERWMDKKMW